MSETVRHLCFIAIVFLFCYFFLLCEAVILEKGIYDGLSAFLLVYSEISPPRRWSENGSSNPFTTASGFLAVGDGIRVNVFP